MSTPLSGKRVLIVEDQYLIAEDIRRAVTALGGEPLGPCASVAAGRQKISTARPDLALLDINLGNENVFDLADELLTSGVPIIFATGYDDWMIPDRFSACGRLRKPVSRTALEAAVTNG
jgi:DNA-binding LytR/AlgR family response regulator